MNNEDLITVEDMKNEMMKSFMRLSEQLKKAIEEDDHKEYRNIISLMIQIFHMVIRD